ncbi:hypothetical protein [Streptomyces sp. NPDC093260]|uniref:hypothetical protein n=1 Tax=Streptomyces sp. NPDC093260 TaxID=3155073 RepID=UPI003447D79D
MDAIAGTGSDDGTTNTAWARNTSDDVNRTATTHTLARAGVHRLKLWAVDPTAVVRRLLIDTGGLPRTCPGPGGAGGCDGSALGARRLPLWARGGEGAVTVTKCAVGRLRC